MNTPDVHQHARRLAVDRFIGGLESEQSAWLGGHLTECRSCAEYAEAMTGAVDALRGAMELPDPALVRATERSARTYARRLAEAESRRRMLAVSCFLAGGWAVLLQPYLWRLFGWLGGAMNLPDPAWQTAFLAMWLAPGIAVTLLLMGAPRIPPTPEAARRRME